MAPKKKYTVGEKILCAYASSDVYYTAKIVEVIEPVAGAERLYKIHYQGWNSRYDEVIKESDTTTKWKDYTDAEAEASKTRLQELMQQSKKTKKKDDMRKSEGGGSTSRASTPSQTGSRQSEKTSSRAGAPSRRSEHVGEQPIPDVMRPRKEVTIAIPDVLKQVMVDDYDAVMRQGRLNSLPAKYTVEQIVKDYADELGRSVCKDEQIMVHYGDASRDADLASDHPTMMECSLGLQDFFDATFASHLLTKFERLQYTELLEKEKKNSEPPAKKARRTRTDTVDESTSMIEGFRPSTCYGFTHLLRLFVRFGTLIQCAPWSDRALASIIRHVHDFLVFLARNNKKYYDKDAYDTADPAFVKQAYA